jgi:cytochrome c2
VIVLGLSAGVGALVIACAGGPEALTPGAIAGADPALGARLFDDLRCAACHAGGDTRPGAGLAPRLDAPGELGARMRPEWLRAYLASAARHPTPLGLGAQEREDLVHFLMARGAAPDLPASVRLADVEAGRQLYHSIGCVACHAPYEAAATLDRPLWEFEDAYEPRAAEGAASARAHGARRDPRELRGIAARTTRTALAAYLRDPLTVHPGGRMPSLGLSAGESADVAAYLFYEDVAALGAVLAPGAGLLLDYHEGSFPDDTVDFDALPPVRSEVAMSWFEGIARREEDFGFRFRGLIAIAAEGMYRFTTISDDGSMLYVDGQLVATSLRTGGSASKSTVSSGKLPSG